MNTSNEITIDLPAIDPAWCSTCDTLFVVREDILSRLGNPELLPNMKNLLEQGYKKAKLRAHSDYMWNNAVNDWAPIHFYKMQILW